MTTKHGFILQREVLIEEYGITARLYRHERTGAELLSMIAPDENKVFGITFRTPPWDATGVAHILEHSVLCGSRKYPVKEPFVELLKGSLQTFLNAFTYPDKTCYPVASQNLQDFYNLIDIYMDAALHPLIDEHTFEQEAWHYELDSADAAPVFKGVVFNEMKGVYDSPDNLLAEHSQRILFPDITYGLDYGGDPRHIPDLTWQQLRDFHRKYYHPSNARIYFYGDDDPEERLRRMETYLAEYDRQAIDSQIPLQSSSTPPPPRVVMPYPAGPDDEDAELFLTVNWRLAEGRDAQQTLALHLLDCILTDSPAAPLRKALLDSGLGEDLTGIGLESQLRQQYFSTGLKGIKPGDEDKVVALIERTLRDLADHGIDPETIEATLNTEEFSFRELNTGNYPRGLSLMITAMQTWLYEGDPLAPIRFSEPLRAIRARLASGEKFFEGLIRRWLLDNQNRSVLILKPDPGLKSRLDAEETARLAAAQASWSPARREQLVNRTRELKRRQSTPDAPEALRCIPSLTREDLPRLNKPIPIDAARIGQTPFLFHDLPTQGLSYLDLGFNLEVVPDDLIGLVPLWARAILETGTRDEDYVALSQRIGRLTGGIDPAFFSSALTTTEGTTAWSLLRGKALDARLPDLLDILRDILLGPRLDDQERIRQIIAEEKAGLESGIIPSGHRFASMRVRARCNLADWLQEQTCGISHLLTLRELQGAVEKNWDHLKARLFRLHELLANRDNVLVNLTTAAATRGQAESVLLRFLNALPSRPRTLVARPGFHAAADAPPEGFIIPAQVNYVGKGCNLHAQPGRITGHAIVASRYLRTAWLWDQVRVQGGAYGGFCAIDYRTNQMTMTSYRDPNTTRTLEIYDKSGSYLKDLRADRDEIDRAVIGAIGDFDSYLLPDAKGYLSMCRHLAGDSVERRQLLRDQILSTTLDHFHTFGDELGALARHGQIAVLGAREALQTIPGIELKPLL